MNKGAGNKWECPANHLFNTLVYMLKHFLRIDNGLTLHLARPELAEAIFSTVDVNRAHLRPWLPWVDPTRTVEDIQKFIRESMSHNSKGSRLTTFILYGEKVVGSLGVVRFDKDHRSCEIGYWLSQEMERQGIMTKACACFIDYLFQKKDLNRVEIKVSSENMRSQKIPLRLGFAKEGTLREALLLYGKFHDLELFSFLKKEWEHRHGIVGK